MMIGMNDHHSSRRKTQSWKSRRKKAERMFAAGEGQSAVARALGVSRQCIHNWYWQWQGGDAMHARTRQRGSGRKAKLQTQQLAQIEEAMQRGPQAFGFESNRWTLWRIATVIERTTGVHYHPSSVWRILRTLGWTLKMPPKTERRPTGYTPRQWAAPKKKPSAKA